MTLLRICRDFWELFVIPAAFGLLLWLAFASLDVIDPNW